MTHFNLKYFLEKRYGLTPIAKPHLPYPYQYTSRRLGFIHRLHRSVNSGVYWSEHFPVKR